MSENSSEQPAALDLSAVASESPEESVRAEEDAVAGGPGWSATDDEGGTVPKDDAQ